MKVGAMLLRALLFMALVLSLVVPAAVAGASGAGPPTDNRPAICLTTDGLGAGPAVALNTPEEKVTPMVAAGRYHTVGLMSDGAVVAVGGDSYGQCGVGGWTDIVQVAAGGYHTVGLMSDGTLVAVGADDDGQCDVDAWELDLERDLTTSNTAGGSVVTPGERASVYDEGTVVDLVAEPADSYRFVRWTGDTSTIGDVNAASTNITMRDDYSVTASFASPMVAAGYHHTVGLKSDGTVVAVGYKDFGQCNVGGWTGITQVAAGGFHTVGLRSDGTVVAVGDNYSGQCDVSSWVDIVQVAAGGSHTVGLKSDGTVVAVGNDEDGECDVNGWADIVQVAAGYEHTVGLKSDGTVVAVGGNSYGQCDVGHWGDIIQVAAGSYHTVGLQSGGTAVAVGDNYCDQCDVVGWDLIAGVNWPLIGGIIAAVVAVGVLIFLARRRRLTIRDVAGKIWGFLTQSTSRTQVVGSKG